MNDFLSMGGYAQYVWPSYALTFVAVIVNIALARRAHAAARAEARRRLSIEGEDR
ncbi:MAG: heme exporter protein CcmD [Steroidobacteraceae bacterium]|jgi:heme exporter protein D|nr:heme exporter protein CcmD [Steroidobacteraceae bacterium]